MTNFYQNVKQYYTPILIVLISKTLIFVVISMLSTYILSNPRGRLSIWELWNVWDAPHYISIASSGYQNKGIEANFIVFLPLLPLLIFISKFMFHTSFLIAGYIVSFFITILLSIMFYKLTLLDYSKRVARLTILFLFIFPTSFFLHIPYTESLFILLSVLAFYFVRKKYYWLSFLFISLASLTRVVGLALIPGIFVEMLILDRENFNKISIYRKFNFLFFGLLLSISGFLVYLFVNYFIFGNPLYFTMAEKQNWYTTFSPFGQGLISAFQSLSWRVGLEKIMLGYGQIIAFILGIVMSIYVLFKVRLSYGLYMLFVLWSSWAMSFWLSMPRYIISLFPMFIVLALFSKNILFRYIWILFSVTLLIILGLIFIQYGPVF